MKAIVNATGDIVDIVRNSAFDKDVFYDSNGQKYNREELSFDFREKSFPKDDDYWTRLEHQATIEAMQLFSSFSNKDNHHKWSQTPLLPRLFKLSGYYCSFISNFHL